MQQNQFNNNNNLYCVLDSKEGVIYKKIIAKKREHSHSEIAKANRLGQAEKKHLNGTELDI